MPTPQPTPPPTPQPAPQPAPKPNAVRDAPPNAPALPRPAAARIWRALAWAVASLALAMVFAAYLSPHLVRDLASRVWACF